MVALLRRDSLSESANGVDISVRIFRALSTAFWKDSEMVVGWMPRKGNTRGTELREIPALHETTW